MLVARIAVCTVAVTVLALLIALPAISSVYLVNVAFFLLISLVLAQTWNWVGGEMGYIDLGHGVYFGVGAYVFSIAIVAGYSVVLCFLFVAIVNAVLAGLLASPLFRMRGHYFAFGTLALVPLAELLAFNLRGATGGADGIVLPNASAQLGSYYSALGLAVIVVVLSVVIVRSRLGIMLRCIRNDEDVAETIGIRILPAKIATYTVSSIFAALAGATYVYQLGFTDPPTVFGLSIALAPIVMTLFGGAGLLLGPAAGVLLLGIAQQFMLVHFTSLQVVLYGAAILLIGRFMPGGVLRASGIRPLVDRLGDIFTSRSDFGATPLGDRPAAKAVRGSKGGKLLSCKSVSMSFGGNTALSNVDLDVMEGEIVGLVGPNGSGKTTLFNCISGIIVPKAGNILFDGARISGRRRDEVARLGVARTFQIPRPFSDMSVLDNIASASTFSAGSAQGDSGHVEAAARGLAAMSAFLKSLTPVRTASRHKIERCWNSRARWRRSLA
jgi:branched-chain amino acid transport system permease protein